MRDSAATIHLREAGDERARGAVIAAFDDHLRLAIGGGVLAHPTQIIWDAILWAADQVGQFLHAELSISVNGRDLGHERPGSELRAAAIARGGAASALRPCA